MFGLLQPLGLWAIAGIAVPLFIHLWNTRQGKTLKVGSILFVAESATQQARSLRFTDVLLLVLRCLLIIAIAFLMARPAWKTQLATSKEKGWVLVEKKGLKEAWKNYGPAIDSLLKAGYAFHYLAKGFEPDKFEEAVKRTVDTAAENEVSYWALLKELAEQVPPDLHLYLFTANRLDRFTGTRPQLALNLTWTTYTPKDSSTRALAKAGRTTEDSIRIITAASKPTVGFYNAATIPLTGNDQYKVSDSIGKRIVSSGDGNVELDTAVLTVAVYTDRFSADAAYVKAAVDAIHQYTKLPINLSVVNNVADVRRGAGWLFWLSEKELPPQRPSHVFLYEKGKEKTVNSWLTERSAFAVDEAPVHLSRLIEDTTATGYEPVWRDGFGRPVLGLEKNNGYVYHFYSRFNPEWNDLPWSSQFVEMLYRLLPENGAIKNTDRRMIDPAQIQPVLAKSKETFDRQKFVETRDLGPFFWLLAFLLFCAERLISLTRKNTVHA